jgi:muconolactone delta-isomerase
MSTNMRFLVEIALPQVPTPEILALIPAEIEHGKRLDAEGIREALFVSAQQTKAWQIYRADSEDSLQRIIAGFPLTPFCGVTITQLRNDD